MKLVSLLLLMFFSTLAFANAGLDGAWKLKGYRCASGTPFDSDISKPEQYDLFFGEKHFSQEFKDSKGCLTKYLPYRYRIAENKITPDTGGRNWVTVVQSCPYDNLQYKYYVGIFDIPFEKVGSVLTIQQYIPYACGPTGQVLIDFIRKR